MTQATRTSLLVGVIMAMVSAALTYAITQVNMESKYATKSDLAALAHIVEKQTVVSENQSKTMNNMIRALEAHLVKDDPSYKTPPIVQPDVMLPNRD